MFLPLRELRHARYRIVLLGASSTPVAWLVFLLPGLANGFAANLSGFARPIPANPSGKISIISFRSVIAEKWGERWI